MDDQATVPLNRGAEAVSAPEDATGPARERKLLSVAALGALILVAALFVLACSSGEDEAGSHDADANGLGEFGTPIGEFGPTEPRLSAPEPLAGQAGDPQTGTATTEDEEKKEEEEEDIAAVGEIFQCGDLPPPAFDIFAGTIFCDEAFEVAGESPEHFGVYKFEAFACMHQRDTQTGAPVVDCIREDGDAFVFFNYVR